MMARRYPPSATTSHHRAQDDHQKRHRTAAPPTLRFARKVTVIAASDPVVGRKQATKVQSPSLAGGRPTPPHERSAAGSRTRPPRRARAWGDRGCGTSAHGLQVGIRACAYATPREARRARWSLLPESRSPVVDRELHLPRLDGVRGSSVRDELPGDLVENAAVVVDRVAEPSGVGIRQSGRPRRTMTRHQNAPRA